MKTSESLQRFELLAGNDALHYINSVSVVLFGIGGVGSWCAEALVRSGIENLTIVDSDKICVTNINRQVQATTETIGLSKVEVLRHRLLSINPAASIKSIENVYDRETAESYNLSQYDYCIDAIDSLSNKVELIVHAINSGCTLFSALGASCKIDPSRIRAASIWKSEGCHLGRFVRKRLRHRKFSGDFTCVFSDELLGNKGKSTGCETDHDLCPKSKSNDDPDHEWCSLKKQINGSVVHITGTFGFFLSGLVIQDCIKKISSIDPEKKSNESVLDTVS